MRRGRGDPFTFRRRKPAEEYRPYGSDFNEGWRLAVWFFAGPVLVGVVAGVLADLVVLALLAGSKI